MRLEIDAAFGTKPHVIWTRVIKPLIQEHMEAEERRGIAPQTALDRNVQAVLDSLTGGVPAVRSERGSFIFNAYQ